MRVADFNTIVVPFNIHNKSVIILEDSCTPNKISLTNSIELAIQISLGKLQLNLNDCYVIEKSSDGDYSLIEMKDLDSMPSWSYLGMSQSEALKNLENKAFS